MAARGRAAASPPVQDAPAAVVAGDGRIPRCEEWLDLPGAYGEAGMRALVWTNYPSRYLPALNGRTGADGLEEALRALVRAHGGWRCQGGELLPDAQSERFWWDRRVPVELVVVMRELLLDAPFALTRFRTPKRSGS